MITIIVPVYNIEDYVGDCIESIIKQKYKELEIILVDDCSTDKSGNICDEYAAKDSRIRVIHQQTNQGLSAARNIAIQNSNPDSKYFVFVDGDDFIDDSLCADAINTIENIDTDIDTVHWGYISCDEQGKDYANKELPIMHPQTVIEKEDIFNKFLNTLVVSLEDLENWFVSGQSYYEAVHSKKQMATVWRYLYSAEVIRKNNLTFSRKAGRGEDIVFNFEYLQCCKGIVTIDTAFYHYRQRSNSLIRDDANIQKKIDLIEAMEETARFTPEDKKEELKNKWRGQRVLVVMNTARKIAKTETLFKGYKAYKSIARHPINEKAFSLLDISKAPKKYKIAMGLLKRKHYFIFLSAIYVLKLLHMDMAPMD